MLDMSGWPILQGVGTERRDVDSSKWYGHSMVGGVSS